MPPAIVAALIGAAVTGTTTGLEASGAIGGGSSGPSAADLQKQQEQQAEAQKKAEADQKAALFRRFAPDAQSQTGGALSDPSFASMVAELSGAPGDIGLAQQTLFGGGTNTPGLATGGGGS